MSSQRYVVYYRVSTQRQGRSGLGIKGQKAAVKAFLKGRGGRVVKEFTEVESGKRSDRPAFLEAVKAVNEHNATLLVAKLDRLSRDVHFIAGLRKDGIDFTACDMPDANKFTINIMAALAEQERELIAERTRAALQEAKRKGRKLGAANRKVLRGLKREGYDKSLESRQSRSLRFAESLRSKIEKLRIKEKRTQIQIMEHFNEYSVPAPRGGQWNQRQVQRVMTRLGIY